MSWYVLRITLNLLEIASSLMKDTKDAQMLSRNLAAEFLAQKCPAGEPEIINTVCGGICEIQLGKPHLRLPPGLFPILFS